MNINNNLRKIGFLKYSMYCNISTFHYILLKIILKLCSLTYNYFWFI